jgi:TfoX/Sxy family transcriptional regulator of competence genes
LKNHLEKFPGFCENYSNQNQMKWDKPDASIVKIFEESLPDDKGIEKKKMFGMPCAFVNGHMFCGVFIKGIMVRLSPDQRSNWIETKKARLFEPMPGKPMKEYIEPPADVLQDPSKLTALILESLAFAKTLKPKEKKKPAGKKEKKARN